MPATTFRDSLRLLRTRNFGFFWLGSLLSNIGSWAQQVAEPWLLMSLGASPFLVGVDSFAMSAPVLLTLAGGVLADRGDRRRVITLFQSVQMLCPLAIVVLLLTGTLRPWMIIALSVVVGITDALSMPSFASLVPTIVDRQHLPAGVALNSAQFNISRVAGPALAGVLMASIGAVGCFAVNAASYLPFIAVALFILPRGPRIRPNREHFRMRAMYGGIAAILRQPHLRGAVLTTAISSLFCGQLVTFCPVLVREALRGDAGSYSTAMGAFGVGGVLGAVALLGVEAGRDRRWLATAFSLAFGVALVLAARTTAVAVLPGVMVLAGVAMAVTNTSTNTVLQEASAPELRGQAASLFMLAMRGGIAVGSLLSGVLVSLWGVRNALLLDGVLTLLVQAAISGRWLRAPLPVAETR